MRLVKQGEKRNVGMKVDGQIVRVKHVTLNKPAKQHFELDWTFDFSGVPQHDLLRLAARGLVIDQRPKFKSEKSYQKLEAWDNRQFNVTELLRREKVRKTREEKAAAALQDLDVEAQIAMLRKLLEEKGQSV